MTSHSHSRFEAYPFGSAAEVESHPLPPALAWPEMNNINININTNPAKDDDDDDDLWLLPEMPLQPTISEEAEQFFSGGKAPDIASEETLSEEVDLGHTSMMEHQGDQIRRTAERKRRDRIKKNVTTLQELIPHCKKKDRASILEDAAEYIKVLKYQVEVNNPHMFHQMMVNARGSTWAAPCMTVTPVTPSVGTGTGIETPFGTGMLGVGFSAQYTPIFPVPSPGVAFLPSMPAPAFTGNSQQAPGMFVPQPQASYSAVGAWNRSNSI